MAVFSKLLDLSLSAFNRTDFLPDLGVKTCTFSSATLAPWVSKSSNVYSEYSSEIK